MQDAATMLADLRTAMQYRMVSKKSVGRIQKQVGEMGRRLIKKCRACTGTAVFQKSLCDHCLRQRRKDQKGGGHRARCRKYGTKYELGVTIKSVANRDGLSCHYCGIETERWDGGWKAKLTTLDHVIPISKGGDHTMDNCVIACGDCNSRKSDKVVQLC
jgi:5-methylcytosine-specific restriction endonuclease McrA